MVRCMHPQSKATYDKVQKLLQKELIRAANQEKTASIDSHSHSRTPHRPVGLLSPPANACALPHYYKIAVALEVQMARHCQARWPTAMDAAATTGGVICSASMLPWQELKSAVTGAKPSAPHRVCNPRIRVSKTGHHLLCNPRLRMSSCGLCVTLAYPLGISTPLPTAGAVEDRLLMQSWLGGDCLQRLRVDSSCR